MPEKRASTDYPIHTLLAERWSPYAFADRPVAEADLRSLFEAARWAPSSNNEQPWRYLVATREHPEEFLRLLSCLVDANQAWAKAAPVLALGVVSLKFARNARDNRAAVHDLGLAAGNLLGGGDGARLRRSPDDRHPPRQGARDVSDTGWLRGVDGDRDRPPGRLDGLAGTLARA